MGDNTKYSCIYADPPWTFKTFSDKGKGRSAEAHYDCMTLDAIKALPIQEYAADNCVLLMWITDPMLEKGFEVIKSWGFTYKTVGFYWAKMSEVTFIENNLTKEGILKESERVYYHSPFMGTGYWTRSGPEQCLLATRGKPSAKSHDVRRLIISPRREHSRKPDETYDRIEQLCDGPYLELFARYPRSGWDTAFSTLEGSTERRWKSNEGKPNEFTEVYKKNQNAWREIERKPINLLSFVEEET